MPLQPGSRLGHYDVTALIGEGGMGQVYQATDTKLKRQVAIKILPPSLASDHDRLARFQREAEVLASLNHPNIAAIYGLEESEGVTALVMELVEGDDLSQRIARGAIPLDEALPIATQIAEALEAAHEQGVIHRDLKPANVKVKADGTVKVLDFGLAKAMEPVGAMSASDSMSPTITTPAMTQAGMILGTAAYMSPEQAKGKTVDKRSDVWAFGAVLYEMLTGTRAFPGEDVSEVLASVLAREPDWALLPRDVSPVLGTYLRRCLHKDPKQRLHDIADVRLAMEGAFETTDPTKAATVVPQLLAWQRPLPLTLVAVPLMALTGIAAWMLKPEVPLLLSRTLVTPEPSAPVVPNPFDTSVAISADGTRVVYLGALEGQVSLFVRAVDELDAMPLSSLAQGVRGPFLSPDGNWVGVFIGDAIYRVSINGGPAVLIAEGLEGAPRGATWGPDDTIMYGTSVSGGLWRVPAGGGDPEELTTPMFQGGTYLFPEFLPGGNAVLFTHQPDANTIDTAQIAVLTLADLEAKPLIPGGHNPRYSPTGHLVYGVGNTLRAVGFDLASLEVATDPIPVVDDVHMTPQGAVNFGVADNGSLVYIRGGEEAGLFTLVWLDREGNEEPLAIPPDVYTWPRVSPDGIRVAVAVTNEDVWVSDLARGTFSRVTTATGMDNVPLWTPNSESVVFASMRLDEGRFSFFQKRADGTGSAEKLLTSEGVGQFKPYGWSPDGMRMVFDYGNQAALDIGVLTMDGNETREPLLQSEANEAARALSPNGEWLAYSSDQTDRCEVYVERFPGLGSRQQISTAGGAEALWSPDGRELFYREGARIMAVAIEFDGQSLIPGTPEIVVDGLSGVPSCASRSYDVSPDGQRFLIAKRAETNSDADYRIDVVLVQNWFQELKRLVPVD